MLSSLVILYTSLLVGVQAEALLAGTYRITNRNNSIPLVAPGGVYQSLIVANSTSSQWLLTRSGKSYIFTYQPLNATVESEYCEQSPLITAPMEEASTFDIIGIEGFYSVGSANNDNTATWFYLNGLVSAQIQWPEITPTLAWTALGANGSEVQLCGDTGALNQQWSFESVE